MEQVPAKQREIKPLLTSITNLQFNSNAKVPELSLPKKKKNSIAGMDTNSRNHKPRVDGGELDCLNIADRSKSISLEFRAYYS